MQNDSYICSSIDSILRHVESILVVAFATFHIVFIEFRCDCNYNVVKLSEGCTLRGSPTS
jgi:hypothetical protein